MYPSAISLSVAGRTIDGMVQRPANNPSPGAGAFEAPWSTWPFPRQRAYPDDHPSYLVPGSKPVCAATIDQLRADRRAALTEIALHSGLGPEQWGPVAEAGPCYMAVLPSVALTASMGSDGRWHLRKNGKLLCRRMHRQNCAWALRSDGRYVPYAPDGQASHRVSWRVNCGKPQVDATTIPRRDRCPLYTWPRWPPFMVATTPIGRVRRRLVEEFGAGCAICGSPAEYVDRSSTTEAAGRGVPPAASASKSAAS